MNDIPDPTTAPPWYRRDYYPDAGQVCDWLVKTSPANRRWWVERAQQRAEDAHQCFEFGHEQQIETLRSQLAKERERVAWLERNYGDPL